MATQPLVGLRESDLVEVAAGPTLAEPDGTAAWLPLPGTAVGESGVVELAFMLVPVLAESWLPDGTLLMWVLGIISSYS